MKYLLLLLLSGCASVQRMTKEPAPPFVPAQPTEASHWFYILWLLGCLSLGLYLWRIFKNDSR